MTTHLEPSPGYKMKLGRVSDPDVYQIVWLMMFSVFMDSCFAYTVLFALGGIEETPFMFPFTPTWRCPFSSLHQHSLCASFPSYC